MIEKLKEMADSDLQTIWKSLGGLRWGPGDMWDTNSGVSMDDWAEAVSGEMDRRRLPKSDPEPDMLIIVQFCPCGCVLSMTETEIVKLVGDQQLKAIEAGEKLDVPTLPSEKCPNCEEVTRMRDEATASYLSL